MAEEEFKNPMKNKKGNINLIVGLVFGVASLIIGVIIAFVIVSTLTNANLLTSGRTTTTVTNETKAWLNTSANPYTLAKVAANRMTYTITSIYDNSSTAYDTLVPAANYTVSAAGVLTTTSGAYLNQSDVSVSYTYVTKANEEYSSSLLTGNFTSGIDNVSGKIPTVLLVAAIVLILSILALLVGAWQKMRMGQGGI